MVGYYPYRFERFALGSLAAGSGHEFHHRTKHVRFVYRFVSVQHGKRAFESHSGVHVFLFERRVGTVGMLVVLHEYIVPYLDVPSAIARGRTLWRTRLLVGHYEYFRVRSARSRGARYPPVVFLRQIKNAFLRYAEFLPALRALDVPRAVLVAREYRHREPRRRNAQLFNQEFVRISYALVIEIISERPVAEHLEKGAMRIVAHFVDVAGAYALLHVGEPLTSGVLLPQKIRHQRVHPRGSEKYRGIVFRYQ